MGRDWREGEKNKDGGEVQPKSTRWQPPIHRNGCTTGVESGASRSDGSLDVWRNLWNDTEMFYLAVMQGVELFFIKIGKDCGHRNLANASVEINHL